MYVPFFNFVFFCISFVNFPSDCHRNEPIFAVTKLSPITRDDDHLMELLECEEFSTVPDYKLYQENTFWPIKENGVLLTGKKRKVISKFGTGTLPPNPKLYPNAFEVTVSQIYNRQKQYESKFTVCFDHFFEVTVLILGF